ncbi:DNase1 protein [Emericellopsis atlantica]|uniref:DNase1 protein n=1 Tax=Emericellopsis atlantica TaxID=2614577 RepID=A0A9P7ZPE8_9HYPO|nr:DNase1 protein [Emericellopsis atlantica]KAG9255427.1 DNase1 protein [Emericellopsis atlantica]
MQFTTSVLALLSSAAIASAGKVTFWTLDDVTRTVYFTSNENKFPMDPVTVSSAEKTTVDFADGFVGNFHAVAEGEPNQDGMLGEIKFGGWGAMTYFDVSAIVNPNDKNNVKQMWPADSQTPMSGCEVFPCDNAYYVWDDVQTKVTTENHIITTLGEGSTGINFA